MTTIQTVKACSCIGERTVKEGYKNADIIVNGKVLSIKTDWFSFSRRIKENENADSIDKRLNGYYLKKVLVKKRTMYKEKAISDTLTIYTGMGGGDCGFKFKQGCKYIIYGDSESYLGDFFKELPDGQNIYWTNICTRTQVYNLKEIKELEKIKK